MARFQRITGPTYLLSGEVKFDRQTIRYELNRSQELTRDHPELWNLPVEIKVADSEAQGVVFWKRYKLDEPLHSLLMARAGDTLRAFLPHQPPAGKLEYFIVLGRPGTNETLKIPSEEPVVARFKGWVPLWALLPHIALLFAGLLLAARLALAAVFGGRIGVLLWLAFSLFIVGGLIFGPIVQKYAFGAFWTGWPFGDDWTDNKTAFMVAAWIPALWLMRRQLVKQARIWTLIAMVVTFAVYLVPHSMHGSAINYSQLDRDSLRIGAEPVGESLPDSLAVKDTLP